MSAEVRPRNVEPRFLDLEQAAAYLAMPENTLRALCRERRVPFIKKVRRLKFDRLALDKWMLSDMTEPVEE